jgi:hypothetical protein
MWRLSEFGSIVSLLAVMLFCQLERRIAKLVDFRHFNCKVTLTNFPENYWGPPTKRKRKVCRGVLFHCVA